jgi:hypothetical protein
MPLIPGAILRLTCRHLVPAGGEKGGCGCAVRLEASYFW